MEVKHRAAMIGNASHLEKINGAYFAQNKYGLSNILVLSIMRQCAPGSKFAPLRDKRETRCPSTTDGLTKAKSKQH